MSTYSNNTPGTAVALRPGMSLQDKLRYADKLSGAGLLPSAYRKQPANVLYAVEYGEMLGIGAMAAINGIHIIQGKPTASAGLIGGLVRSKGHKLRVKLDRATMTATAQIVRADDPDWTFEAVWTLDRAVTAGLCQIKNGKPWSRDKDGKPTAWEKYPENMLKARAITEVARDACEDALFGLHYTPEEMGADVDEEGEPIKATSERVARPATVPDPDELTREQEAVVAAAGIKMPAPVRRSAPAPQPAAEEPLDAEVVEEDQVEAAAVELLDLKNTVWATALEAWPQLDAAELKTQLAASYRAWAKDRPEFAPEIGQVSLDELGLYLNEVLVPLTSQSAA